MNKSDLEKHNNEVHVLKKCETCSEEMEIRFFSAHNCPKKPTLCDFCEAYFPANQFKEHSTICGNRTDQCPRCKDFIRKNVFKQHAMQNSCIPYAQKLEEKAKLQAKMYEEQEALSKARQRVIEEKNPIVSNNYKPKPRNIEDKNQENFERPRARNLEEINQEYIQKNEIPQKEEEKKRPPSQRMQGSNRYVQNKKQEDIKPAQVERNAKEERKGPASFNQKLKEAGDPSKNPSAGGRKPVKPVNNKPADVKQAPKAVVLKRTDERGAENAAKRRAASMNTGSNPKPAVKNPSYFDNYYADYSDDIPAEIIQESLQDQIPPIPLDFQDNHFKEIPRNPPENTTNFVEDEILRAVMEESKKDNFGLSEEEKLMNEIVLKSLKER